MAEEAHDVGHPNVGPDPIVWSGLREGYRLAVGQERYVTRPERLPLRLPRFRENAARHRATIILFERGFGRSFFLPVLRQAASGAGLPVVELDGRQSFLAGGTLVDGRPLELVGDEELAPSLFLVHHLERMGSGQSEALLGTLRAKVEMSARPPCIVLLGQDLDIFNAAGTFSSMASIAETYLGAGFSSSQCAALLGSHSPGIDVEDGSVCMLHTGGVPILSMQYARLFRGTAGSLRSAARHQQVVKELTANAPDLVKKEWQPRLTRLLHVADGSRDRQRLMRALLCGQTFETLNEHLLPLFIAGWLADLGTDGGEPKWGCPTVMRAWAKDPLERPDRFGLRSGRQR